MPVLSGSSGPSGGPGAAYIVDVVGGSAGVREVNETELDPIQPREFSRAVIWTVGTVPFVFLIGLLAVSYTVYKKGASDTVLLPIEIECKGIVIAAVTLFIFNCVKRFIDVLDMLRCEKSDSEEATRAPPVLKEGEEAKCEALAVCLCFCLRWKHVWNIAVTEFIYVMVAFSVAVFGGRLLVKGFKIGAVYGAILIAIFYIVYCLSETGYLCLKETKRLLDPKAGYIFLAIYGVMLLIFIIVFWVVGT